MLSLGGGGILYQQTVSANIPDLYIIGYIFLVMLETRLKLVAMAQGVLVDVL